MKTKITRFWSVLKKKLASMAICLVVVLCCGFVLLTQDLGYFGFREQSLLYKMESVLLDLRFKLRGQLPPKSNVGILAIDDESLLEFGRFPFSRSYYELALKNLKKLGVEWIGFDSVFSEVERAQLIDANPVIEKFRRLSRANVSQLRSAINDSVLFYENNREISGADRQFARSIREFGQIVLGYFYLSSPFEVKASGREKDPFTDLEMMLDSEIQIVLLPEDRTLGSYHSSMTGFGVVGNIPAIAEASPHVAFFSNQADSDAIVRWSTLVRILNNRLMPSLSLKIAAEKMNREIVVMFDSLGIESIQLVNREDDSDSIEIPIDPWGQGRMLINHRGGRDGFYHYSLAKAYRNSFSEEEKSSLKGSVLLLGATSIGINDQRPNPFDSTIDGVENHAAVVDNILSRDFLTRPLDAYKIEFLILLAIGLVFSPIMIFSNALYSGILTLAFLSGYYLFDKYYWFDRGIWAYMGLPFIEVTGLFLFVNLYKHIVEEREKRQVKGAFTHYLSSEVIEEVMDNPEALQLGGKRQELTVFFSDVRDFTSISETLTPEQLSSLLNEYFTPMIKFIQESKGCLDKLIGDAIMAFWGAPVSMPNHADIAADVSVKMIITLDQLQPFLVKKYGKNIDIGIGLNTGAMSVGNMGSHDRFQYTVMGDEVNLGARLEGLTKEYGVKIMISEKTVRAFRENHHLLRDLDDIRVKGKNEPVKVFELMRPDFLPQPEAIRNLISEFESGREAYRQQDWKKAKSHFSQCLLIRHKDGPSLKYLERIEMIASQPAVDNWDGVYTFKHK